MRWRIVGIQIKTNNFVLTRIEESRTLENDAGHQGLVTY